MPRDRQDLTVTRARRLRPPRGRERVEIGDGRVRGLGLRATSRGVKTFTFVYRSPLTGRQRRATLNHWPQDPGAHEKALAEARQRALSLQAQVVAGLDPLEPEVEHPAPDMTVAELLDLYLRVEARPSIKTAGQVERTLRRHLLPRLGARPLRSVARRDLHALLDELVQRGRLGAAWNVRKYVTRLFYFALERDLLPASPAAHLRVRALQRPRADAGRDLSDEELRAVWAAIQEERSPWRECMTVLLLTGQRRTEIAELRWGEVDERERLVTLPPERYKTGVEHVVPLSAMAWEALAGAPRWDGCEHVFSLDGRGPVRAFGRLKGRLDAAAARHLGRPLPRWRAAHDLRVTVRSRLAALGVPAEIGEAVLGHLPPRLHRVYQKHRYLAEKREALELWARHLREVVDGG